MGMEGPLETRFSRSGGLNQPMPAGIGRRFNAVGGAGLAKDVTHVVAHGPDADEQLISNEAPSEESNRGAHPYWIATSFSHPAAWHRNARAGF